MMMRWKNSRNRVGDAAIIVDSNFCEFSEYVWSSIDLSSMLMWRVSQHSHNRSSPITFWLVGCRLWSLLFFYCQTSEHVDSLESASFTINAVRIGFLFRSLLDFHRGFRFKRHLMSTSRHSTVTMIIDTLESIRKDIGIALVICTYVVYFW